MRGVASLSSVALLLVLAGPVVADHGPITSAEDKIALQEGRLLDAPSSFDLLLYPDDVRYELDPAVGTTLPGSNPELSPNLDLLLDRTSALHTDVGLDVLPAPTLAPASTVDGAGDTIAPQSYDAPVAAQSYDGGAATSQDGGVAGSTDDASNADDGEASTQASSTTSAHSAVEEAWDALSPAEKVAVSAGLAGLLLFGPLAMYSRIKRDDALENDTRRTVYEIVEAHPGICIKDVADKADVSYSTASYHLDRLLKLDYITRKDEGNKVLYYKNGGTFSRDEQELVPVLKNEEAMRVFEHILENPWCYRAEVAEALDVSHTTVNWHLKRLQKADLVSEHREGRNCHLYIEEEALARVVDIIDKIQDMGAQDQFAVAHPVPA